MKQTGFSFEIFIFKCSIRDEIKFEALFCNIPLVPIDNFIQQFVNHVVLKV